MPFVRVLVVILVVMAVAVAGLALFRPGPLAPPPVTDARPAAAPRTATAPPPRQEQPVLSPGDASSPAEMTAQEAAEAQRRLEKDQEDEAMGAPEMMPPDLVRN